MHMHIGVSSWVFQGWPHLRGPIRLPAISLLQLPDTDAPLTIIKKKRESTFEVRFNGRSYVQLNLMYISKLDGTHPCLDM